MVTRKIGSDDFDVGFESYNTVGGRQAPGAVERRVDQEFFLIMDKSLGKWDLNLGVGYGRPEDHLVPKAIGVPIGYGGRRGAQRCPG